MRGLSVPLLLGIASTLCAAQDNSSASASASQDDTSASASATPDDSSSAAPSTTSWRAAVSVPTPSEPPVNNTRRSQTQFGVGYEVWWETIAFWDDPNRSPAPAEPELGFYNSNNASVLRQQAEWISGAGIDFVLVDFSNSLGDVVFPPLDTLFDVYSTMDKHPQITILIGTATNGTFDEKIERAYGRYMDNQTRADMFVQYKGKPLVTFYSGPTFTAPPEYTNDNYTIRFMGALNEITGSPYGTWSWLNRAPYVEGQPTNITSFGVPNDFDGWTADSIWSVSNITGYITATNNVTGQNITKDTVGNLTSPTFTITEPVMQWYAIGEDFNAFGAPARLNIRNVFLLQDAETGEILRSLSPPGDLEVFTLQQWNTKDLIGRNVTFVANGYGYQSLQPGWFGFTALQQLSSEFVSAAADIFGNGIGGVGSRWDTHTRLFGAYYVYQMQAAYDFEPDFVLCQQFNEGVAPDEYSVESGNDIEPSKYTKLAGVHSDGWGDYYLNLTGQLIQQYRDGAEFPAVMLDTRYP